MTISLIIFLPIIVAIVILFMDSEAKAAIRTVTLVTAFAILALAATTFFQYRAQVAELNEELTALEEAAEPGYRTAMFDRQILLEERYAWVDGLGIAYHVGVDGLTAPMVLLSGMVAVTGVLISWRIEEQVREFMAFFLLLVAGVIGVFVSVDLFLLFFFYELALFPMYILIAGWGWVVLREYAAMKLTIYILIGSLFAIVGAIAMVFVAQNFFANNPTGQELLAAAIANGTLPEDSGTFSFNMTQLMLAAEGGAFNVPGFLGIESLTFAKLWFPFIFIGFATLAGVFPFHNWSPDGHVAAPTAVSMIHAGVLMKLGAFAALRVGVQLLPSGAQVHLPWIVWLTLINVVLGALIAFRQRDFKYVIGFSSVSHMGLVSMGWATMNATGMLGAGIQMFSHGAMTALFFGCVGMVYDRAHTRDIPSLGGFIKPMPWVALAFVVGGLTSMGMPGFSGFVAEFPIFMGLFEASEDVTLQIGNYTMSNYYSVIAIIAVLGIIITAAYVLRVAHQVFFGEFDAEKFPEVGNIAWSDRIILLLLAVPLMVLGLYPDWMAPMIEVGLRPIVAILGG